MIPSARKNLLLGLLVLIWAGIVLGVYYVVHKPFGLEQLQAWARMSVAPLGFIATVVTAHGLGRMFSRFFPMLTQRATFALQVGLGLAILGWLMLLLGVVGGYWTWVVWTVAGVGLLLNAKTFFSTLPALSVSWPSTWPNRALALFIVMTLSFVAINALTPPWAWDSLVYHLTGPKLYVQTHHLQHDLDLAYLGFPQWGSMLFTWSLLLVGPELAQMLHFLFMVLTLMLLPTLIKFLAPSRAWLAAGMLAAVPTATLLAGWAYVEWLTMFAGLVAFICLLQVDALQRKDGAVVLAGLATGLALSAKYTAAGLVLGLGVWAIIRLRSIRLVSLFGLGIVLAVGPYLIKNLILTGNPVYPFFLAGKFWDADRAYWYGRPGTGLPVWVALFAPWDMTVWGVEGLDLAGKVSYGATLGPLLLILIPLALILGWRNRSPQARAGLLGLGLVCAVAYLVWSVQLLASGLLVQSRLLFPVLPLAVVLATAGFDSVSLLDTKALRIQFVLGGLVAVVFGLTAIDYGSRFFQRPALPVVLGWQSQTDFLRDRLGAYALVIEDLNRLPAGSKIEFLWEPRSYYCAGTIVCEPDALLDRWWHLRQQGLDAEAIVHQWQTQGVTHVLVFESGRSAVETTGFDPFTAADWDQLRELRETKLELVTDYLGAYQLYSIGQ
jgi:hypothetical protein